MAEHISKTLATLEFTSSVLVCLSAVQHVTNISRYAPTTVTATMPVSAALLLDGGPAAAVAPFQRGDKATSSVKLRRKREDGQQGRKTKSRHSGDFSFFAGGRRGDLHAEMVNNGGDFDYITFPNGVPFVHELRVARGGGADQPLSMPAGESPNPVKVTIRENGGGGRRNLVTSRAVSASAVNIHQHCAVNNHQNHQQQQQQLQQDVRKIKHKIPFQNLNYNYPPPPTK